MLRRGRRRPDGARRSPGTDFAAGGPTGRADAGEAGLLVARTTSSFDKDDNVWVVTDISSGSLKRAERAAVPVPRQQRRVHGPAQRARTRASRSASRTCRSRPRAPGRTSRPTSRRCSSRSSTRARRRGDRRAAIYGDVEHVHLATGRDGNKTIEQNPSTPLPSVVAIYRPLGKDADARARRAGPAPGQDRRRVAGSGAAARRAPATARPARRTSASARCSGSRVRDLLAGKVAVRLTSPQKVTVDVRVRGRVRSRRPGAKRSRLAEARTLASRRVVLQPGQETRVVLRPTAAARLVLRRRGASVVHETLQIAARNDAGQLSRSSRQLRIG